MSNSSKMVVDFQISVPWGFITGKGWGDPCGIPVLAVHGLQDNAGTFDALIPHLPPTYYIAAVELPGHGWSSHFPDGILIHFLDYVVSIKRIVDYFQWEKFYYVGHSFGGHLGMYFAALYPQYVLKLVLLDSFMFPGIHIKDFLTSNMELSNELLEMENKLKRKQPPTYTINEAMKRLTENRLSQLTDKAAKLLIKRSLVFTRDSRYLFSTDQRLKLKLTRLITPEQHFIIMQEIKCPTLLIIAKETMVFAEYIKDYKISYNMLKQNPNFEEVAVEGNHDVHNNEPSLVVPLITQFFYKEKCGL